MPGGIARWRPTGSRVQVLGMSVPSISPPHGEWQNIWATTVCSTICSGSRARRIRSPIHCHGISGWGTKTLLSSSDKMLLTSFHRVFNSFGFRRKLLRTLARCCGCCPRLSTYRRDPRPVRPQLEAVPAFPPQNRASPQLLQFQPDERTEVLTCFAAAIREGWTGDADHKNSGGSTKRARRPRGSGIGWKAGTVRVVDLALDGRRAQFVTPLTAWRRRIGLTNLAAQHTILEDNSTPSWPRS